MALLKLRPSYKDYLWGGHRLVEKYNKEFDGDILAESWELSCHPDGPSYVVNGSYAGKTLQEYIDLEWEKKYWEITVRNLKNFLFWLNLLMRRIIFPFRYILIMNTLCKNEGQYGKTEMWYIMDCEEGAFLYYGFKKEVSKEEIRRKN